MALVCIPSSIANKLKEAFKSGDIPFDKLYDMSSADRHSLFEQYMGKDAASLMNAKYDAAKIAGIKKAAVDYVTASEKAGFARTAAQGEFAKGLRTPEQVKAAALAKVDETLAKNKEMQGRVAEKLATETDAEKKANLEFKAQKLKDQEQRLTTKREDIQNPIHDRLLTKIQAADNLLHPGGDSEFMADLVATKMGQEITPAQGKYIVEQADKIRELAKQAQGDSLNAESDAKYLNATDALNKYIENLKPVSAWRSILKDTLSTSRNLLLMNPSTPIKMVENQAINSSIEAMTRRLGSGIAKGANGDIASEAYKYAQQVFNRTGGKFNVLSMETLDDNGKLGEKQNFNVSEGMKGQNPLVRGAETISRKANQLTTKVAIDWEHNLLYTKFYQRTALDAMNITSTRLAKSEGLSGAEMKTRAAEIFNDALRIEPKTDAGLQTRAEAQKQAAFVTSTNKTVLSDIILNTKNYINSRVPGLGEVLAVIAKIPSNIISNSITAAGPGIPLGAYDIVSGLRKMGSKDPSAHYQGLAQLSKGIQTTARTVGVLTAAAYFTSQLTPKDFKTDVYGNQYVKIGGLWVNKEYFSMVAPAIGGMMDVKMNAKKGQSFGTTAGQYVAGATQSLKSLPLVSEANTAITDITNKTGKGLNTYWAGLLKSRSTPAFINSLTQDRPVDRLFFGAHGVETDAQVKADNEAKSKKAAVTKAAAKKP